MMRTIGIIGTGHLAGYLVAGWRAAGPDLAITLSPRSVVKSADLAKRFGARVAPDNQGVVDAASVVVLATRPPDAVAACRSVTFRPGQLLLSVAAGVPLAALAEAAAPATAVRALPISCAAIGESPTLLYPDHAGARELLALLGTVHAFEDETTFTAASAITAWYAWLYALFGDAAAWAASAGVQEDVARVLVLETARGAAGMALAHPDESLPVMLSGLATPGGLTELGLGVLHAGDGLSAWPAALDAVLERLRRV
jgi:pyrroline-5-carboxylate reductase